MATTHNSVLRSNSAGRTNNGESSNSVEGSSVSDTLMEQDIERFLEEEQGDGEEVTDMEELREWLELDRSNSNGEDEDDDEDGSDEDEERDGMASIHSHVPVVHPRCRYAGACNVETVKDGKRLLLFLVALCSTHHSPRVQSISSGHRTNTSCPVQTMDIGSCGTRRLKRFMTSLKVIAVW